MVYPQLISIKKIILDSPWFGSCLQDFWHLSGVWWYVPEWQPGPNNRFLAFALIASHQTGRISDWCYVYRFTRGYLVLA